MPPWRPSRLVPVDDIRSSPHMRRLGSLLLGLGATLGGAVALAVLAGVTLPGVSWLIAVGIAKLTFLSALGMMGAGATFLRLHSRAAERSALPAGRAPGDQ